MRMRWLILLALLITPAQGWAAIAFDASSIAAEANSVNASSHTWSHTTSGSDRVLFVTCSVFDAGATVSGVTYNGVAMTEVFEIAETTFAQHVRTVAFVLAAPATGANNIVATLSEVADVSLCAASSWNGVDQTTPNRTPSTNQGFTTTNATVTVSNAQSGDVVVDGESVGNSTISSTQTSRQEFDNIAGDQKSMGHASAAATGSTVMEWTHAAEAGWSIGAMALIPASGGGGAETFAFRRRITQ